MPGFTLRLLIASTLALSVAATGHPDAASTDDTDKSPPPPKAPGAAESPTSADDEWKTRSLYTLEVRTLEGEPAPLKAYEGNVALVVNVASYCGNTPQYAGLQALYERYREKGFVVLAFPCNDFGNQEPDDAEAIRSFCTDRYAVTFPLFEKVSLKPGPKQSAVYTALEAKTGHLPKWNFGKYVVSRDGRTAVYFDSKVKPDAKELLEAIDSALAVPAAPPTGGPAAPSIPTS